jgi:hypothetical protein
MELEHNTDSKAEQLLNQELDCFNHILLETDKYLNASSTFSIDSFMNLLEDRECWIKLIAKAEDERKTLQTSESENRPSQLSRDISAISRKLIRTDAKILDVLQTKKLQTINELTKLVNKQDNGGESWSTNLGKPKLLDLRLK